MVLRPWGEDVAGAVGVGDEDCSEGLVVGVIEATIEDVGVIDKLDVDEVDKDNEVDEVDEDELDKLDVVVGTAAAPRTRKPGLDKSGVFGSKAEEGVLNRKTYLALVVSLTGGIAMVHAKFPGAVKLMFSKRGWISATVESLA